MSRDKELEEIDRLIAAGNNASAQAAIQQAIEEHPDDWILRHRVGELYLFELNRPADAIESFEAASKLNPSAAGPLQHLCLLYLSADVEFQQHAHFYADSAIESASDDWLSHYCLGLCWKREANYFEAISSFVTASRLNSDAMPPWHSRGACYKQVGLLDDAERCYRKAIALERTARSLVSLARLQFRLGRVGEASESLDAAEEISTCEGETILIQSLRQRADGTQRPR